MKNTLSLAGLALVGTFCASAAEQTATYASPDDAQAVFRSLMFQPQPAVSVVPKLESLGGVVPSGPAITTQTGAWLISSRERDHQTWSSSFISRDAATGRELSRSLNYVELGSGLNYLDAKGQWQPTQESFEGTPNGGFVAQLGSHRLALENNINSLTAIEFITPDGIELRSGPLAVGYFDPVDGRNVIFATIRDTAAELTAPNEVTYRSAFDGIDASIRITYRRAGMSALPTAGRWKRKPSARSSRSTVGMETLALRQPG